MSNLEDHVAELAEIAAAREAVERSHAESRSTTGSGRTNWDRAHEGLELCIRLEQLTGTDTLAEQVSDVLCQMMHLCRLISDEDGQPINFERAMANAVMNFDAECERDPDQ